MSGTKAEIWSHLVGRKPTGRESAVFFALYLLFQEDLKVVIVFLLNLIESYSESTYN